MQSVPSRSDLYIVTACVRHYQRLLGDTSEGMGSCRACWSSIVCALYGFCTCMAGLGEVCSHVAAMLFTIDANTQLKNNTASTSLPCSWLPPTLQHVTYSEIVFFFSYQHCITARPGAAVGAALAAPTFRPKMGVCN